MINHRPVLPSSLLENRSDMDMNFSKRISENTYLRLGVVVDIIEIEDDANISKFMTEYEVMTIENDNTSIYKNCISVDAFGGVADYFVKKLRKPKDSKKVKGSGSLKKQNGSIVLLLCIDGSSEQGVILGAIAHPDRQNGKLTKDKGQHLEGEFNGINWQIDKNGALTVTFKSATDNDAKPQDAKAGGATFKIEKDGSIEAADGNKEKIRIDKTKKTIDIAAESDISVTTDANVNITAKKNISAKATTDLLAEAGGSLNAKSGGAFNITAGGAFSLKAPNVDIMADGATSIKGSSVRISAPMVQVGNGGTPAIILTTQFLGIGNLGAPTLSIAIGPFSSSVFIAP